MAGIFKTSFILFSFVLASSSILSGRLYNLRSSYSGLCVPRKRGYCRNNSKSLFFLSPLFTSFGPLKCLVDLLIILELSVNEMNDD